MIALNLVESDHAQDIISRCKRYIASNHLSTPELAKLLRNPDKPEKEMNRSTLNQVLSGQCSPSTVGKYINEIERFLEATDEVCDPCEYHLPTKPSFLATHDALAILGLCKSCQEQGGAGVVYGTSGYGKTHTLRQYARKPKVIYIQCGVNTRARDILRIIEDKLFIPRLYKGIAEREENVAEYFRQHPGYLIVLDEADKIFGKETIRPLDTARHIYDLATNEDGELHCVGLVITGESVLETRLKTLMPQFANRIDLRHKMEGLTKDEVMQYLEDFHMDEDSKNELVYRACNKQNGCFRLLDRTVRNVIRLLEQKGETGITLQIIRDASSMMML